jgi:hypothetical protein
MVPALRVRGTRPERGFLAARARFAGFCSSGGVVVAGGVDDGLTSGALSFRNEADAWGSNAARFELLNLPMAGSPIDRLLLVSVDDLLGHPVEDKAGVVVVHCHLQAFQHGLVLPFKLSDGFHLGAQPMGSVNEVECASLEVLEQFVEAL